MSLAALAACCPTWADVRPIDAREALVDIVAVRSSKTFTRLFELRLLHLGDDVSLSEREIGNALPSCCPERHINPDGSFCTGLRAGKGITDETAPAWWDKLHAFALCQETAAETGFGQAKPNFPMEKPPKWRSPRRPLPINSDCATPTAKRSRSTPVASPQD